MPPLGIPLAANDAGRAMQRRDWGGVLVSSLGMLPAAKPLSAAERLAAANARNLRRRLAERTWNLGRLQGMVDQSASQRRAATDERQDPLRPGARI